MNRRPIEIWVIKIIHKYGKERHWSVDIMKIGIKKEESYLYIMKRSPGKLKKDLKRMAHDKRYSELVKVFINRENMNGNTVWKWHFCDWMRNSHEGLWQLGNEGDRGGGY